MARRIVVGLDGSDYGRAAVDVGLEVATRFKSILIGVAVVDQPGIEATSLGAGIGAYRYAKHAREIKLTQAEDRTQALLDEFQGECAARDIVCELTYKHCVPFQAIVDEARCADAIIVGLRTYFTEQTSEVDQPGDTVRRLMHAGVCPVLAVPCNVVVPTRALVAYDGSMQAARAMRAFAQLVRDHPITNTVTLLQVGEGTPEDEYVQLDRARKYLECYGFDVEMVVRKGKAADVIEEEAALSACAVVLGAYGRRGVRHMFFGSTADRLIRRETTTLFVYH